ncbi:uncharacterized protein FIBRA_04414 [Fibroporia radiculosa]|uniref:non-specific serine/threonine protein kinase n=1 Tax=Fibroporia radiculosa TaxID=599839 RepID=J4HWI5_9APHY|nr:uncharacterized protein FIBRA_04414 [Fibroporia radiculosa]CCM02322.1 predicted protein [Fibroporia radiculosa]
MATAALLSQHSSNPLEVPSSDSRNKAYRRQYLKAQERNKVENNLNSSDDPHNAYNVPELEQYHSHLAELYPNSNWSAPKPRYAHKSLQRKDEDSDMFSDDDGDFNTGDPLEAEDDDYDIGMEGIDHDGHDGSNEELTLYLKPREEQEEIEEEIADLEETVPQLSPDYKIVDRLGTGTFSSVYKAIDLGYHSKWDNTPWHGFHSPSSSAYYQSTPRPEESKVYVAVKRIYVTSGPERIRNEISIMEDCRGCRHVSQLITAFRQHDQIVAIMPYHRNEDFRDYYRVLPMEGIKAYFRCMFRALRDIHARGIIHRDVKPANFLFDPRTGIGTLCDFGLACRMERGPTLGACLHTAPSREHPHGHVRDRAEYDVEYVRRMQKETRIRSSMPSEKIGYPEKDIRPPSKANRAGTRGFRAPEVLFKCGEQTGAIDVWSAGMILLFFLTGKFPLFHSSDDVQALMELAAIFGKKKMERIATLHSRMFQSNVPSLTQDGITWREFVERQNTSLREPRDPDPRFYPYSESSQSGAGPPLSSSSSTRYSPARSSSPTFFERPDAEAYMADIANALDFVEQAMHPESTRRLQPRRALAHPFLREPGAPDDDEFFPHPFGEGVCGEWHFIDDVTDDLCVRVPVPGTDRMEIRRLISGEGVAIGSKPCEFHREDHEYDST